MTCKSGKVFKSLLSVHPAHRAWARDPIEAHTGTPPRLQALPGPSTRDRLAESGLPFGARIQLARELRYNAVMVRWMPVFCLALAWSVQVSGLPESDAPSPAFELQPLPEADAPATPDDGTLQQLQGAAEAGHDWAQFQLALRYAEGDGVARDSRMAVYWFRKAAAREYAAAEYALGVVHAFGEGVARDEVLAVHWFRLAAEQGYPLAQHDLGLMYYKGMGVARDDAEAVRWWRKAAVQGHAPAQSKLGAMYIRGTGVPRDPVQAYAWISIAAARGEAAAARTVNMIDEVLMPIERERARKLAGEYRRAYGPPPGPSAD